MCRNPPPPIPRDGLICLHSVLVYPDQLGLTGMTGMTKPALLGMKRLGWKMLLLGSLGAVCVGVKDHICIFIVLRNTPHINANVLRKCGENRTSP